MVETHSRKRVYLWVVFWLAVLTATEVGITYLAINPTLLIVSLLVLALVKALLVALFYMHLRYDFTILSIIGGFPFFLAVVMFLIVLADRTLAGGLRGG